MVVVSCGGGKSLWWGIVMVVVSCGGGKLWWW